MKISEVSTDEQKDYLHRAYTGACDAFEAGELDGKHPSHQAVDWMQVARARDNARDEGGLGAERIQGARSDRGAGLGAVEIQNKAKDDVQPELTAGGNGGNGGATAAQDDGRYVIGSDSVGRFITNDGRTLSGDAAIEASARQSNPRRVRAQADAISGYGRLK